MVKVSNHIKCPDFPCADIDKTSHILPDVEINPSRTKVIVIAEAPPSDKADYFYATGNPFYLQTTIQVFSDAGFNVSSMQDILNLGVYITTAVKCGKTQYAISLATIKNCARLLENEMSLFPNIKAYILGGDVAIKAMNYIWEKKIGKKVIPAGSTYKIRKQAFYFEDKRVFPSYTPAGKNFLIEKSKRKMVAEDIKEAMMAIR
jgi:uracil-DNA glycosylase